jgi:hypothetical protein
MGEFVAWGLGLALGYTVRNLLTSWWRISACALAAVVLGTLITMASGEMASEPWLVLVDIGQVTIAAVLGAYALPYALRRLRDARRRRFAER